MEFTPDETVNKLILLFVLDKMEIPLTENSILDICTSRNNWLNGIDCILILHELMETSFIYNASVEGDEPRYGITYQGRECLSHFFARIPQSFREEITAFARDKRLEFKRSQEYVSEYAKNEDGSYTVTLKIKEPSLQQPLLEIHIKTPNRNTAILTCKKWGNQAPNVFEYLYDSLIED